MVALGDAPAVRAIEDEVASWRPERVIVRVDRPDPAKNLVRGFLAYERLLEDHPEHHGRVALWAFLQPSRQDVDANSDYLEDVLSPIDRINSRFAPPVSTPTTLAPLQLFSLSPPP